MANQTLNGVRILLRNDTAANWTSANPVLSKGEMGVEIDTGKFKFGDGATAWNSITSYSGVLVKASSTNGNIKIDGIETVVYTLPVGTSSVLGGVKSSSGTNSVTIAADGTMSASHVTTADQLGTARTISVSGDVTGSTTYNGAANSTLAIALVSSGVTAGTYPKVTVDSKGRVTAGTTLTAGDIPSLTVAKISDAGTAASKNVGTAAGNVPILGSDGKLADSVIPALAIGEVYTVASESAMLGLSCQQGDLAVRTDGAGTFILKASPASTLANWVQLKAPTDVVTSVNGSTGAVVLTTSNISEGSNLYWTQARFDTAFSAKASTGLSDTATILRNSDTLILNCGNA